MPHILSMHCERTGEEHMTRDDIIQLAREAELQFGFTGIPALERFAHLVAAAEREQCAKVADDWFSDAFSDMPVSEAIRARGSE